jgi:2'-5' RNA ligase
MATRRLFVGLAPDERTAEELHANARKLLGTEHWRLYGPRDIHLTLCFLGAVPEEHVEPLASALRDACSGLPAPSLEIAGLGAFPSRARPRVVWAGVRADPRSTEDEIAKLRALEQAAGRAIETVGLAYDRRAELTPHLTLARPARGRSRGLDGAAELQRAWPWQPSEVLLFESVGGSGERYPRRVVGVLSF